jgi:hypothetical protein
MIESPILQELRAEWTKEGEIEGALKARRKYILKVLEARFGVTALELEPKLKEIDEDDLDEILNLAATCRSLASFGKKLSP